MMQPKISVIVPVYKAEKYLHRCVDSILAQTFTNFEIILVDDGSPDKSGEICDEYAAKDSRVRVFHKENGGVSSARNLGLENTSGEWVLFVDADDWLVYNTFAECMKRCDDCDMVRFGYISVFDKEGHKIETSIPNENRTKEYLKTVIERTATMAVWGAIYRKNVFQTYNIFFDSNLRMGEDWVVLVHLILHSKKIKFLPLALYQYNRYNDGSCVNNFTYGKQVELIKAFLTIRNIIKTNKRLEEFDESLQKTYLEILCELISVNLNSFVSATEFFRRRNVFLEQNPLPDSYTILTFNTAIKKRMVLLLCMKGCLGYRALLFLKIANSRIKRFF